MLYKIKEMLLSEGIDRVGMINIADCDIINERIFPQDARSAILFIIPYRSTAKAPTDGFSEYARIYDYHKYSRELYERILNRMNSETGCKFYGFCDHSPINEKLAAAKCGLGVIGRNSLFIDKKYGSFVFIGSILTDAICNTQPHPIEHCIDCARCVEACPSGAILEQGIDIHLCLSAISQKKTKSDEEKSKLKAHRIAWGCDVCQNVCPHNATAEISPIPYFSETRIDRIDRAFIDSLSDGDFERYAFSYKGRKIVIDNLENI